MSIDSIRGLGTSGITNASSPLTDANSGMGRDDFLKLLTHQIKSQDPLDPLKNHEFVAQLAQFSSLEQQIVTNENLSMVQVAQMSLANGQLTNLIGKDVVARGDGVNIVAGSPEPIGVELDGPANTLTINIKNSLGQVVRSIDQVNVQAGNQTFAWDGKSSDGVDLPDGKYTVSVQGEDANGDPVSASPLSRGTVTGVSFENGYPELILGDARILPSDIISISPGSSTLPPSSPNSGGPQPPQPGGNQQLGYTP